MEICILGIYIMIYVFLLLLSKIKFNKYINVISFFTSIWFFFGGLSVFGYNYLRVPKMIVHIYIWIFVVTFDLFFLFCLRHTQKNVFYLKKYKTDNYKIIQIVSLILSSKMIYRSIILLLKYKDLNKIREFYFSKSISELYLGGLIFKTIPVALLEGLIIYYVFFYFENKKTKYLIFALINVLIVTLINFGRFGILSMIYSLIILGISKQDELDKKFKKNIKQVCLFLFIIIIFSTIIRGQNILRSTITYFSGSLSFLDYIIENPDTFHLEEKKYGYLTFGIVTEPIVLFFKVIKLTTIKIPSYYYNFYCQNFYNIGREGVVKLFNANTTILYFFLKDFGSFGVVIGGMVLGSITAVFYNKWKKGKRIYGLFFVYFMIANFNSIMIYQLCSYTVVFVVLVFFICVRKSRKGV